MPYGLSEDWLQHLKLWAAQKSEIREVWIFGSRATGCYRTDSDIDIALKLNGDTDEKDGIFICEAERWSKEIQKFTPVKVDLDHGDDDCESDIVVPALKDRGIKVFP